MFFILEKMVNDLTLSSQVLSLEEQRNNFKKKCQELETLLQIRNDTISKLKLSLHIEKFKSHLFSQIISQNTEIKIGDIYQETDDGIKVCNFQGGNVPVIVHDFLHESKSYNISDKKKVEKPPGKNF